MRPTPVDITRAAAVRTAWAAVGAARRHRNYGEPVAGEARAYARRARSYAAACADACVPVYLPSVMPAWNPRRRNR